MLNADFTKPLPTPLRPVIVSLEKAIARDAARRGSALERIRALVLLAGSVRKTSLQARIGRSVLSLPVRSGQTIMDCWGSSGEELAAVVGRSPLQVRVVLDHESTDAPVPPLGKGVAFSVERDPSAYRGTAGIVRDLCCAYDADDFVLVAGAAQILRFPLVEIAEQLASRRANVVVAANDDGTPSLLMLVRCGALADVAGIGFIDLKEQALPAIAARHNVEVVSYPTSPVGLPVRTEADYILAVRQFHQRKDGGGAFEEDWQSSFSLVESSESVHRSARIHDSVVLKGARVEADAVVVRSVVCPGAVVRRGRMVVDQLVAENR
jgi:NDP-sugar pyrophosphorylase family protein